MLRHAPHARRGREGPGKFRGIRIATAVLVSLGIIVGSAVTTSSPAMAAAYGAGYDGGNGHIGSYQVSGTYVYCLRPAQPRPTGTTTFDSYTPFGMSATNAARVSWAITNYGQTTDNNWASAVAMYVWSIADPTEYNSHGMSGDSWYIGRVPVAQRNTVLSYLQTIRNGAASITAGATVTPSGSMTFAVDQFNNYLGTLTISGLPAGTSGSITLTNGVFEATGTPTIAGVTNGAVLAIQGIAPEDGSEYKISATGNFTAGAGGGYRGEVSVYTTPGAQPLGGPGRRTAATNWVLSAEDPTFRATDFVPVLTTEVPARFVQLGEPFSDTVTFGTVANPDGVNNSWAQTQSGDYAPIMATGILYGPFLEQPEESDEAPDGAPIAATATVTTSLSEGPTTSYTVTATEVATEAGFYTWVWTIDSNEQHPFTQLFIPLDYVYTDRFGQVIETQITPSSVRFATDLAQRIAGISDNVSDRIEPYTQSGAWLEVDGEPVPVTLHGTAYWSAEQPVIAPTPPASAEAIGTYSAIITPGSSTTATGLNVGDREGWVSWVWCIRHVDQPGDLIGFVSEWCDQYGLPAETLEVVLPTISTVAQGEAVPYGTVTDTALVEGVVPQEGLEITFAGYLQDPLATDPQCEGVPTFASTEPILAREAGEYTSEEFAVLPEHVGTIFWVETARHAGTGQILHVGECGIPSETTRVDLPVVSTVAVPEQYVGAPVYDAAFVSGRTPEGAYLVFQAFLQNSSEAVCDESTLVFDSSSDPVLVDGTGEYVSPEVVFTTPGTYFWVEFLHAPDGELLHAGECGYPTEITLVSERPPLPSMGPSGDAVALGWAFGGGTLALGLLMTIAVAFMQRHQNLAARM